MFKLICFLTFIISSSMSIGKAASIEVTSLAHGSCWVQDLYNEQYKVASFNESTSFEINGRYKQKMNLLIQEQLPDVDIVGATKQDVYLYCSSFGVALVSNIETPQGRFCSWAKIEEEKVELVSVGLSEASDFCHGYKVADLVLIVSDLKKAKQTLNSSKWKGIIKDFDQISDGVLRVTTFKQVAFQLDEVAAELLNSSNKDWLKNVDYNYLNHPIGEATLLKAFSN